MANNLIRLKIENTTVYGGKVLVRGEELKVDAKTADRMVERDIASIIGEEVVHEEEQEIHDENHEDANDELAGMNVDELREYAAEAGVDLRGKTKKADILAAIREAM